MGQIGSFLGGLSRRFRERKRKFLTIWQEFRHRLGARRLRLQQFISLWRRVPPPTWCGDFSDREARSLGS